MLFHEPSPTETGYYADPVHRTLRTPYTEASYGGFLLVYTPEWCRANLPQQVHGSQPQTTLQCTLLDTTDGKEYVMPLYLAYEHGGAQSFYAQGFDWNEVVGLTGLMSYWYGSHHCPCHRKHEAQRAGAVVEDSECEGKRFLIKQLVCEWWPELILYSETLGEEELEASLARHHQACGGVPDEATRLAQGRGDGNPGDGAADCGAGSSA